MVDGSGTVVQSAQLYARTAREAFKDQAAFFRSLPEEAWNGPTGCAAWSMNELAGHIVGEAVWFPALTRNIIEGTAMPPASLYEELKTLSASEMADRMDGAADDLTAAVESADEGDLAKLADLGFAKMPLGQALYACAVEAVFHNWDGKAGRDAAATIPVEWAQTLARQLPEFASMVAKRGSAQGRWLLDVGDGVGPITVTARGDSVQVERGLADDPDVTVHLSADQVTRLVAGRFSLENGSNSIGGDPERAQHLNRLFPGIGV